MARKVKYARIPSGAETCAFCFMLASRGFTYSSAELASHSHSHCDCVVTPGFKEETKVEGYDEDGMYERYRACRKLIIPIADEQWQKMSADERMKYNGETDTERHNDYITKQIVGEMRKHDPRWLYDGEMTQAEIARLAEWESKSPQYAEVVDAIAGYGGAEIASNQPKED